MLVAMHQMSDSPHTVLGSMDSVSGSAALCCVILSNVVDVSRPCCRRKGGIGCSLRDLPAPTTFSLGGFPHLSSPSACLCLRALVVTVLRKHSVFSVEKGVGKSDV